MKRNCFNDSRNCLLCADTTCEKHQFEVELSELKSSRREIKKDKSDDTDTSNSDYLALQSIIGVL